MVIMIMINIFIIVMIFIIIFNYRYHANTEEVQILGSANVQTAVVVLAGNYPHYYLIIFTILACKMIVILLIHRLSSWSS